MTWERFCLEWFPMTIIVAALLIILFLIKVWREDFTDTEREKK